MPYSVKKFYEKFEMSGYEQQKNIVSPVTPVTHVRRQEILSWNDDPNQSKQGSERSWRGNPINLLRLPGRLQTPGASGDQNGKVQQDHRWYQSWWLCSHARNDENPLNRELVDWHEAIASLWNHPESRPRVGDLLEKNCWNWEMNWNQGWCTGHLLSVQTSLNRGQLLGVRVFRREVWVFLQGPCVEYLESNGDDRESLNRSLMCLSFVQGSPDSLSEPYQGRCRSYSDSNPWNHGKGCCHWGICSIHLSSASKDDHWSSRAQEHSDRTAALDVQITEYSILKSAWYVQVQDQKSLLETLPGSQSRSSSHVASCIPSLLRAVQAG